MKKKIKIELDRNEAIEIVTALGEARDSIEKNIRAIDPRSSNNFFSKKERLINRATTINELGQKLHEKIMKEG